MYREQHDSVKGYYSHQLNRKSDPSDSEVSKCFGEGVRVSKSRWQWKVYYGPKVNILAKVTGDMLSGGQQQPPACFQTPADLYPPLDK